MNKSIFTKAMKLSLTAFRDNAQGRTSLETNFRNIPSCNHNATPLYVYSSDAEEGFVDLQEVDNYHKLTFTDLIKDVMDTGHYDFCDLFRELVNGAQYDIDDDLKCIIPESLDLTRDELVFRIADFAEDSCDVANYALREILETASAQHKITAEEVLTITLGCIDDTDKLETLGNILDESLTDEQKVDVLERIVGDNHMFMTAAWDLMREALGTDSHRIWGLLGHYSEHELFKLAGFSQGEYVEVIASKEALEALEDRAKFCDYLTNVFFSSPIFARLDVQVFDPTMSLVDYEEDVTKGKYTFEVYLSDYLNDSYEWDKDQVMAKLRTVIYSKVWTDSINYDQREAVLDWVKANLPDSVEDYV